MSRHMICVIVLSLAAPLLSACAPVAIGAGGAVAADKVAEDNGGNLF